MSNTPLIRAYPPNYAEIRAVFPGAAQDGVIFAYAPAIFVPSGRPLALELYAHENVHIERQKVQGVEAWWAQYLTDGEFRYHEELLAHRAEYRAILGENPSRAVRRSALKHVAKKLTSPLYGRMVTLKQAMEQIAAEDV